MEFLNDPMRYRDGKFCSTYQRDVGCPDDYISGLHRSRLYELLDDRKISGIHSDA